MHISIIDQSTTLTHVMTIYGRRRVQRSASREPRPQITRISNLVVWLSLQYMVVLIRLLLVLTTGCKVSAINSTMVGGASSVVTGRPRHRARWEELDLGTKLHIGAIINEHYPPRNPLSCLFSCTYQFQYNLTAPIQAKAPCGLTFCPPEATA